MRARVWFHRCSAFTWIALAVPATLWWRESVYFVILASIYANVKSDWSASEAADDRAIMRRLDKLERKVEQS